MRVACYGMVFGIALLMGGCQSTRSHYASPSEATVPAGASTKREPASLVPVGVEAGTGEAGIETATAPPISRAGIGIYPGSGNLVAQSSGRAAVGISEDGEITLNFVNTDIREVIDAILGDALKRSYVIDPKVQGTVTLRTSRPLKAVDVIPVLEDVLGMNGAALVQSNDTYKIVPLEQAATGFQIQPGFGIHIIPLKFASATGIRSTIEPFVPPGRTLRVDAARNLLIFTGTSGEARDLEELVGVFDVDWMAGMSFALFPLQSAEAKNLAQELDHVFGQEFEGPLTGIVQFVPIERLNAILVITPQPAYLDKASVWIDRLDRGEDGAEQRIYVYLVQNGRAKDLAAVLSDVFGVSVSEAGAEAIARVSPGLQPAEITRYPGAGMSTTRARPGTSMAPAQPLRQSAAGAAAAPPAGLEEGGAAVESAPAPPEVPPEPSAAQEGVSVGAEAGIRIVADERNNALVIRATPVQYRMIQATLKQLDIIPLQVLIEATIAEVTLKDELKYGLQWFFNNGNFSVSLSQAAPQLINAVVPGFNLLYTSSDARVVLSALAAVTDVRVISSPQLMVLDNEAARLQVGDQVPIATQSAVAVTDPEAPIVNTIEYRDTGVILDLIPHVNAGGLVTLDIIQEVSSVAQTVSSGIDSPTIQQRQIQSSVAVQTGETIVLGGLIRDSKTNTVNGIPVLSEIPILGNLFKTTDDNAERTELVVLLTPRVVRNTQDARDVTEELRRRLPSLRPLELKIRPPVPQ